MIELNELTPEYIREVDREGMWELLKQFPQHWVEGMAKSRDVELTIDPLKISNICMCGMGSSAISADLLKAYVSDTLEIPMQLIHGYDIPAWVDDDTLFIACSFSGNTEEILMALEQARKRGAQIVAVTSGGQLLLKAADEGFDYYRIPGGMPARAALAYAFVPLYRLFQFLGFIDDSDASLEETAEYLAEKVDLYADPEDNEALALADEIRHSLPIIYSNGGLLEPVNHRWREQFEENAKTLAYGNFLPEMNHNEIIGWEQIAHLTGRLSVIILQDREDSERMRARMAITKELVKDQVVSINTLETEGNSRLTRMFSLVQLADWTSLYLALLIHTDPTPVTRIDLLKRRLAEWS